MQNQPAFSDLSSEEQAKFKQRLYASGQSADQVRDAIEQLQKTDETLRLQAAALDAQLRQQAAQRAELERYIAETSAANLAEINKRQAATQRLIDEANSVNPFGK